MKQGKVFTLILAFIISVIMLSMIVSLAGQNSPKIRNYHPIHD